MTQTFAPLLPDQPPAVTGQRQLLPFIALVAVFAVTFLALLARGFDLGFTGDLLDYAFHYDRLGTFGGMRWLVTEHLHRHLLAGLFSAPIAYLFPWQSAPWYAYAFLAHFASAVMVYVLTDAIQQGARRWLSLAVALMFTFHVLQAELNFQFPTSGHGNSALFLSLLSLWFYLQSVRRERRSRWWIELSLATYVFAIMIYEQTVLFFLLHPLIAYFEDRDNGALLPPRRWVTRVVLDSLWFPVAVVVYLFLLKVLFPPDNDISFAPQRLLSQISAGLSIEYSPAALIARIAPALAPGALVVTLSIGVVVFLLVFGLGTAESVPDHPRKRRAGLVYLTLMGIGISATSILSAAPTSWKIAENPRLIYPSAIGVAMLLTGGLSLLLSRFSLPVIGRAVIALIVAFLVGTGATRMFQMQSATVHQNAVRLQVLDAVRAAVPSLRGDQLPYFLLVSDADPTKDLYLYAQDIRFPLMFDRIYGTIGIVADAIYTNLDPALAPKPTTPGSRYSGQYIIAEPEGIYSPLLPRVAIDPSRLVILRYDSQTGTASVLPELPPDVLARANIAERTPVPLPWRTNYSLIVTASETGS